MRQRTVRGGVVRGLVVTVAMIASVFGSTAAAQEDGVLVVLENGGSVELTVGDQLQFDVFGFGPTTPGGGSAHVFTVPAGLDYVSGECRPDRICGLSPGASRTILFDVVGPTALAEFAFTNVLNSQSIGGFVTISGTMTTSADFTDQQCAVLEALTGLPGLDDQADVITATMALLETTIPPAGNFPSTNPRPVPEPTGGTCRVDVEWTADTYGALDAVADDFEWTRDQATQGAGVFIVAVLIALLSS